MSSKLHHRGKEPPDAVAWEPLSKDGTRAVRPTRDNHPAPQHRPEVNPSPDIERQINDRIQSAHQKGVAEGEAAGKQQATAQYNAALEKVSRTVAEVASFKPRLRHESEEDVVKLAMAIARRILYRELTTDPSALLGLVRAALDKLDSREIQRLRVNPQDATVIQQQLQQIGTPRKIDVVAESALPRGSAIFETTRGSLDVSTDTQLNEIDRGFTDLMKRAPE